MSAEGPPPDPMGPSQDVTDVTDGCLSRSNDEPANGVPLMPSEAVTVVPGSAATAAVRRAASWLGGTRLGLIVMALVVGAGAGLGAVVFRWLIYTVTWLVTGHQQFGQQGHVPSLHFPWLGIWFLLLAPIVGGLLYGPLIQRFAREARGHGVPEVMLAVAENGGRIRPQVTVVKALASAMCIGTGGSVGREGPIVQIGSAFASTLGQVVRMSETRLRIIVACGAAGGIAATFNAPITGLFFGFEIVLREFSLDAMFGTILAAVTGDLVSRAFFGSAPFFTGMPHGLVVGNDYSYLLIAVLGLAAGLIGVGFKTFLYWLEDALDDLWKGRPEWARPAVGGVALGVLLLVLPQMYGVGYPVMDKVVAGHVVLWLIVILMLGKILAASLTLSIGGSGGVFAPSLFTGAMAGMAFGIVANHLFGSSIGPPAHVRGHRDGWRVRSGRPGAADLDRERGGDDRQFHAYPAGDARHRDRRRALKASDLRQHLYDQAAAPWDRHRAAQGSGDAQDADRRGGDAAAGGRQRSRSTRTRTKRGRATAHRDNEPVRGPGWPRDRGRPTAGAVSRRGPRTSAATAGPVRSRWPARALPRRPRGPWLDHRPGRTPRARTARGRLTARDRARSARRGVRRR